MPAFLIERDDRSTSADAIWADNAEQARVLLEKGEKAAHQQSDVIAEMMKIEPKVGRYVDAFYKFMVTPRDISGNDLPHRP